MEKENRQPSKALSRVTNAILTAIFLVFLFIVLGTALFGHFHELLHSLQMTETMQKTLPENPTPLDKLAARINGFTGGLPDVMWHKDEMGYINSAFQFALGKRMINTGSRNMIRLNTGHLYDLSPYQSLKPGVDNIADIVNNQLKDLPVLFVYEHPTLYDDAMMPVEYAALDHAVEMADEVVTSLREKGVRVLDSRDVLTTCGRDLNDLLMVTDQHWSTLAAITMAQAIAGEINDMTGAALDPMRIEPEDMNQLVHEKLFIGKYGQRIGPRYVTPDDIVEYWPKYDTHIHRHTLRGINIEDVRGDFRTAVTRPDRLEPAPGKTWNTYAYTYYGQVESYSIFENPDAPDFTILLIKDSYSAPIGTFLSLLAKHVVYVDLRQDVDPLDTWVKKYQPDAVVIAYSLQMLRDDNYEFG